MIWALLQAQAGGSMAVWQVRLARLRFRNWSVWAFPRPMEVVMPRGDKSSYTDKQKRKAEHIEESYENRGIVPDEAERRAWATVNKADGGGKKSGGGRSRTKARRKTATANRSEAAKKGWVTRRRNAKAAKKSS